MARLIIGSTDLATNRSEFDGTNNQINYVTSAEGIIPAGAIMWVFGSTSAPSGYLKANGSSVSRTVYANLFSAIGTLYGSGDGSTSFTLPDLRGEFIRSFDDGVGIDAGRTIGSFQAQSWKSFWVSERGYGWNGGYTHGDEYSGQGIYGINGWTGQHFTGRWANPSAAAMWLWDSNEIRGRNVAGLACIKY